MEERDTYGKAFLQSFNLWRVDPVVADFVRSPRFARVAAALARLRRRAAVPRPGALQGALRRADAVAPGPVLLAVRGRPHHHDVDADGRRARRDRHDDLRVRAATVDRSLRGPGISDESQATFAEQLRASGLPLAHPRRAGRRRRHLPRRVDGALGARQPHRHDARGDDGDLRGRRRAGGHGAQPRRRTSTARCGSAAGSPASSSTTSSTPASGPSDAPIGSAP